MNRFTTPTDESKTIPRPNPDASLLEVREAYRRAEARWDIAKINILNFKRSHPAPDAVQIFDGKAVITCVNTLKNENPQLRRLCAIEQAAKAERNEKLRAMLRAQGKLVF